MIRETQGDDIAAACGQLAINYNWVIASYIDK
jgi:adenine C2-methylase RlmN of 23S rRNA A2503 and tRNA A37